jgi:hypothetical protein
MNSVKKTGDGLLAYQKRIKKPGTVDVGVIDAGEHEDSEVTVAQIATWNEFGTETEEGLVHVPERSFMRSTIREKKKDIIALQKRLLVQIRMGKFTVDQALGILGEFAADKIRRKIVDLKIPPNAAQTIAKKGSSNPLIGITTQLKNSITYEVNKKVQVTP